MLQNIRQREVDQEMDDMNLAIARHKRNEIVSFYF